VKYNWLSQLITALLLICASMLFGIALFLLYYLYLLSI